MEWSAAKEPGEECKEMGGISKSHPGLRRPNLKPFIPEDAAATSYPITTYQPTYFVGESLEDVKNKINGYCDGMDKQFYPVYDPITGRVNPSRHVRRLARTST